MGRQPGRARLGGDGGAEPDPDALPARRVPAAVRPARRLVEHRRQHLGGHDLLGAALPGSNAAQYCEPNEQAFLQPGASRSPPASRSTGRPRCSCSPSATACTASPSTARPTPSSRRIRRSASPRTGVRHQRLERAALGAAGQALHRRVPAGQGRPARQGLQHALGRLDGGRRVPRALARRHLHARATPRTRKGACASCTRPTRCRSSSSRRAAPPPTAASRSSTSSRRACTSAARSSSARRTKSTASAYHQKIKGPARGPFRLLETLFQVRLTSLVISNIDTWPLPPNTALSLSSALIMRRFFLS